MTVEDIVEYVRVLEVPPGAVLAVKAHRRLSHEQAADLHRQFQDAVPGRPVIILPPDLDLVVALDVE